MSSVADAYADAATDRCLLVRGPGHRWVRSAGVRGLVAATGGRSRLVVTDDVAAPVLRSVLPDLVAGTVTVLDGASLCADVVRSAGTWSERRSTAMVRTDLDRLPTGSLPGGLHLVPVGLDPAEPAGLELALTAADRAESLAPATPPELGAYLRSLPGRVRLWAAVDDRGEVVATSGTQLAGATAYVLFVNTVPSWQRRGVGLAMTAAALVEARAAGATRAVLDASDAGVAPYARLGFAVAGRITRSTRSGPAGAGS